MSPRQVVIIGAGDHGRVIAELLRARGDLVAGFVEPDSHGFSAGTMVGDDAVLGDLVDPDRWRASLASDVGAVIALGSPRARRAAFERVTRLGMVPVAAVHPTAVLLGGAQIDPGAQVCAAAVIGVAARIGANAIIDTAASVDHDCQVAPHAFVGPGARLAGRVSVEEGAWVGLGASVREGIRIGAWSLVGAGAAVVDDVPGGARVGGVPARPLSGEDR